MGDAEERPSAVSRIGWAVLAILIVALAIGAVAIVADDQPSAGSPMTPEIVGGGGPVPEKPAVTKSVTPQQVESLSVAGVGNNRTLACGDKVVSVSGVNNTVVITGRCTRVDISGIKNTVTIDEAGVIDVSGMNNKVVFHSGSPKLTESGIDNTVQRG
jgi:hypothetical protein